MTQKERDKEIVRRIMIVSSTLKRAGLFPYAFDPGVLCYNQNNRYSTLSLDNDQLAMMIRLIKRAYPETKDEELMITEYKEEKKRAELVKETREDLKKMKDKDIIKKYYSIVLHEKALNRLRGSIPLYESIVGKSIKEAFKIFDYHMKMYYKAMGKTDFCRAMKEGFRGAVEESIIYTLCSGVYPHEWADTP